MSSAPATQDVGWTASITVEGPGDAAGIVMDAFAAFALAVAENEDFSHDIVLRDSGGDDVLTYLYTPPLRCAYCESVYELDDGIDWEACPGCVTYREQDLTPEQARLIENARDLLSDPGSNPEYERALVELIINACGWDSDTYRPIVSRFLGLPDEETRIDAVLPWCVTDNTIDGPASVLGRFGTSDAAAAFIETQPEYLTGRYGLTGPAED